MAGPDFSLEGIATNIPENATIISSALIEHDSRDRALKAYDPCECEDVGWFRCRDYDKCFRYCPEDDRCPGYD